MKRVLVVGPERPTTELTARLKEYGYEALSPEGWLARATGCAPDAVVLRGEVSSDGTAPWRVFRVQSSARPALADSPGDVDDVSTLVDLVERLESSVGGDGSAKPATPTGPALIGNNAAWRRVKSAIHQLARQPRSATIVLGEYGTGKQSVAAYLHRLTYPDGEFISIDPAQGASQLARFFDAGSTRLARLSGDGATIFVREICEASPDVQARLVRMLDGREGARAARLVATSSRDLEGAARDGTLRHELAAQFPFVVQLPPLRERPDDIPLFVGQFAQEFAVRLGRRPIDFSAAALSALVAHDWPGNVAELRSVVERLVATGTPPTIDADQLPTLRVRPAQLDFRLPTTGVDLVELEREVLIQALRMSQNNQTRAGVLLGLTRDQVRYRMAKFAIGQVGQVAGDLPAASARTRGQRAG